MARRQLPGHRSYQSTYLLLIRLLALVFQINVNLVPETWTDVFLRHRL